MTGTPSNRHANRATSAENDTHVVPEGSRQENAAESRLHNLLTGCPHCDQHGPDLPPLRLSWSISERRDFHRTWHDLGRALTNLYRAHRGTLDLPEEQP